nr:diagnostic antigen gp50 [Hymenolepis microstoma]
MILTVLAFVLLQIKVSPGIVAQDLNNSTCSRIVTKSYGKVGPLLFAVAPPRKIFYITNKTAYDIFIVNSGCYINGTLIGVPCSSSNEYYNITIDDVTPLDEIVGTGNGISCIVKFVPNCTFKSVGPGDILPQSSFPFARFEKGQRSVEIKFSTNGTQVGDVTRLVKGIEWLCVWREGEVIPDKSQDYCRSFTKNPSKQNQLDYTFTYNRTDMEPSTFLYFLSPQSRVGVSIYWEEGGVSPDVLECEKYPQVTTTSTGIQQVTTTSTGCAIGPLFSILVVTTQWIFT